MTVKECYTAMGGDYDDVLNRFRSEDRVRKFALMFLQDKSYEELDAAFAANDDEAAFRGSHTLKGVGQNLSFTALFTAAEVLTNELRAGKKTTDLMPLKEAVDVEFKRTMEALQALALEP